MLIWMRTLGTENLLVMIYNPVQSGWLQYGRLKSKGTDFRAPISPVNPQCGSVVYKLSVYVLVFYLTVLTAWCPHISASCC